MGIAIPHETYWTTRHDIEVMGNSYSLLDLTVYGWQEAWEDSPSGWRSGRQARTLIAKTDAPFVQRPRMDAKHSDDLQTRDR